MFSCARTCTLGRVEEQAHAAPREPKKMRGKAIMATTGADKIITGNLRRMRMLALEISIGCELVGYLCVGSGVTGSEAIFTCIGTAHCAATVSK